MADELKLPIEMLPAPDQRELDTPLGLLNQANKFAGDAGVYAPKIRATVQAILACRTLSWRAADRLSNLTQWIKPSLTQAADDAERQAGGGPAGASARAQLVRSRQKELVVQVSKEMADEGTVLGKAALDAMVGLKGDLDVAKTRLTYSELGEGTRPLAELVQEDRLSVEIQSRGVRALYETYSGLLAANALDGASRLERASEAWLLGLQGETRIKKVTRLTKGQNVETRIDDEIQKERMLVDQLLREFASQRAKRVPPELTLATQIYSDLLVPAFQSIVGQSSWDLPTVTWNAALAGSGALPGPLEILSDPWWTRHLPDARTDAARVSALVLLRRGGADGPPGYTKLGGHVTALGGRVRMPGTTPGVADTPSSLKRAR